MKYVRYLEGGSPRYGALQGDLVTPIEGDIFGRHSLTSGGRKLETLDLLAPCAPSKVVGIGLNYREHAREIGAPLPEEPRIFLKPPTAVVGPGASIVWPSMAGRVDYEAELVVVMGRPARDVEPEAALEYVLGYTCGNDVTARDLQQRDKMPVRAKSFDTFGPIGPCIATDLDPDDLLVECLLNGEVKQSGRTADMVFDVRHLVSFVSRVMTLLPGDVIFTGALPGIGPMSPGDVVEVRIPEIGTLRNRVVRPTAG